MIAHLRGRLLAKQPQQAIIEAGGVGYDVVISVPTFSALPQEGAEVSLFIHTHVREDMLALYGFLSREEKRVFERLITVSGVGPKLAVTIQSGLSTERLVGAIRGQDHATLSQIPGIGKRLAERLVVDLKGQVGRPGDGADADGDWPLVKRCALRAGQPGLSTTVGAEGNCFGGRPGQSRGGQFRDTFPRCARRNAQLVRRKKSGFVSKHFQRQGAPSGPKGRSFSCSDVRAKAR